MIDLAGLLAAYTAALNRFDLDAVAKMFAGDATYDSPGLPAAVDGRAAIMQAFQAYFAAHPDQVNGDEDIRILGPLTLEARWWLVTHGTRRHGTQRIAFDEAGKIKRIEVWDD